MRNCRDEQLQGLEPAWGHAKADAACTLKSSVLKTLELYMSFSLSACSWEDLDEEKQGKTVREALRVQELKVQTKFQLTDGMEKSGEVAFTNLQEAAERSWKRTGSAWKP